MNEEREGCDEITKSYNLARNLNGLTVRELQTLLQDLNPEALIVFKSNYGDYHRTQQALPIKNVHVLGENVLAETAYSHSGLCIVEGYDPNEDEEQPDLYDDLVIVLS